MPVVFGFPSNALLAACGAHQMKMGWDYKTPRDHAWECLHCGLRWCRFPWYAGEDSCSGGQPSYPLRPRAGGYDADGGQRRAVPMGPKLSLLRAVGGGAGGDVVVSALASALGNVLEHGALANGGDA